MVKKREQLLEEEDSRLAGYAVKNSDGEGREYQEKEHPYRIGFQRDKDRIIHSQAFRRLEYKTQVFIASIGDNYRTRLTHTMEVAAIARTVSGSLGLNSYLAESIALAHDLGHAPYGHAGQDILAELMRGKGGFEHNKQSLRIVRKLENRYAAFPGLNLCRETILGIMKHGGEYEESGISQERLNQGPSLEAMITDVCDSIAYNTHDVEDGLESGLIRVKSLSSIQIWQESWEKVLGEYPKIDQKFQIRETIRTILNSMVTDLIMEINRGLLENKIESRDDLARIWREGVRIVSFSESMGKKVSELKKFLNENLYKHPEVLELSNFGKEVIQALFTYFESHPKKMPESFCERIPDEGLYRIVCDYIAGMTDRYAEEIAIEENLIDPFASVF